MASNLTVYVPIPNGSEATPGVWDRRYQQIEKNIRSVNSTQLDGSASANSLAGRLYVAGRLQPQQYLEFKQTAGGTSRISARGGITVDALQGALTHNSSLRVETQFAGSPVMTVGGVSGVIINSGKTLTAGGPIIFTGTSKPLSSGDVGTAGEVSLTSQYVYFCVSTGSWRRAALSGW
jgi:hypothetical protein